MSTSASVLSHSEDQTRAIGRSIGQRAQPDDVVLVEGPLGAGKTVLVQGIAAGLGVGDGVISPTFVLVRQHAGRLSLVHADLYRLESRPEIDALGLLELSAGGVLAVEWADRAPWLQASDRLRLVVRAGSEPDTREISASSTGPPHLLEALLAGASP